MIRKYGKLFALAFVSFLASCTVVSAKELTIKEIGAKVDEIDKGARSAFVIGTHVFSGNRELTTEDIMVGAWTIDAGEDVNNPDVLLSKMSINVITRSTPTSDDWHFDEPVLGSKLDDNAKVDVDYVNYNYDGQTVNTDEVVSNAISSLNDAIAKSTALKGKLTVSYDNGTIMVKTIGSVASINETETLEKLLTTEIKSGNYSSIKLTEIVAEEMPKPESATIEAEEDVASAVSSFVKDKKSFTIEFAMADGIVNKAAQNKYSVKFVNEYNTDEKIVKTLLTTKEASNDNYDFTCEKGTCTLNVKVAGAKANAVFVKALIEKLTAALDEEDVKDIVVGSTTISTSSGASDIIYAQLAAAGQTSTANLTLGNLLGQEIVITINLKDGSAVSQNNKNSETYTINVVASLNTDESVETSTEAINAKAGSDYKLDYKDGVITFAIIDPNKTISKGNGSGLLAPLYKMKESGLFKSVILKYGSKSVDLISGEADTLLKFVNYLAKGDDSSAAAEVKLSDINGKTITIELTYNDNVTNAGHSKYTVKFTGSVNTDTALKALVDKLSVQGTPELSINTEDPNYVIDLSKEELTGKLKAADFANEVRKLFENDVYESITVTFNGKTYNISKNDGDAENLTSYGDLTTLKDALDIEKSAIKGKTIEIQFNVKSGIVNLAKNAKYTVTCTLLQNTTKAVGDVLDNLFSTLSGDGAIVPKAVSKGVYLDDKTMTFEVKLPTTTVGDLAAKLKLDENEKVKAFFEKDWYKSVTFIYGTQRVAISKDSESDSIKGFDKLVEALGEDAQMGEIADGEKLFTIEFVLNDGVTNVETVDGKDVNTSDTKLVYNIVLSKKLNANTVLQDKVFKTSAEGFTTKVVANNTIQVLYSDDEKLAYDYLKDDTNLYKSIKSLLEDVRFYSIEIKFGNQDPMTFVNGTSFAEKNLTAILDEVFKDAIASDEFDYKNAKVAEFVKALGSNKITLTIKTKEGRAVFEENNSTSITYELKFSKKFDIISNVTNSGDTEVKIDSAAQSSWKDNVLTVTVTDANKDKTASFEFKDKLLTDLFGSKGKYNNTISSIEINGVIVTESEYENAAEITETSKLVTRLNSAIKKQLNIDTLDAVKASDLAGKELSFVVKFANGVLSENANTSETFTVKFVDETTK